METKTTWWEGTAEVHCGVGGHFGDEGHFGDRGNVKVMKQINNHT